MPAIIGSTGADRSNAWIRDFSSTHSTSAFSGGSRYNPTTSRTVATNCGSLDSLKVSTRCGCSPNAFQIRPCGCPKPLRMSCGLLIFAEEAAEAVAPIDLGDLGGRAVGEWP